MLWKAHVIPLVQATFFLTEVLKRRGNDMHSKARTKSTAVCHGFPPARRRRGDAAAEPIPRIVWTAAGQRRPWRPRSASGGHGQQGRSRRITRSTSKCLSGHGLSLMLLLKFCSESS